MRFFKIFKPKKTLLILELLKRNKKELIILITIREHGREHRNLDGMYVLDITEKSGLMPGSIYPQLASLEVKKHIKSSSLESDHSENPRVKYALTRKGVEVVRTIDKLTYFLL